MNSLLYKFYFIIFLLFLPCIIFYCGEEPEEGVAVTPGQMVASSGNSSKISTSNNEGSVAAKNLKKKNKGNLGHLTLGKNKKHATGTKEARKKKFHSRFQ